MSKSNYHLDQRVDVTSWQSQSHNLASPPKPQYPLVQPNDGAGPSQLVEAPSAPLQSRDFVPHPQRDVSPDPDSSVSGPHRNAGTGLLSFTAGRPALSSRVCQSAVGATGNTMVRGASSSTSPGQIHPGLTKVQQLHSFSPNTNTEYSSLGNSSPVIEAYVDDSKNKVVSNLSMKSLTPLRCTIILVTVIALLAINALPWKVNMGGNPVSSPELDHQLGQLRSTVETLARDVSSMISKNQQTVYISPDGKTVDTHTAAGLLSPTAPLSVRSAAETVLAAGKEVANVSLLIPCSEHHFGRLGDLMESIANQSVQPLETIVALSIRDKSDKQLDIHKLAQASIEMPTSFKVHVRGGQHFAGSNREFLLKNSRAEVVTFFDCDDMMHPQRIEVIDTVFRNNPDLEATLHGYQFYSRKNWNTTEKNKMLTHKIPRKEIEGWTPTWPYERLWSAPPITRLYNNMTWDVKNHDTEPPNHLPQLSSHWFFPVGMGLKLKCAPHNGWISIRRSVALEVPYPTTLRRGQDAIYNWRLLKSNKNFSSLPWRLGAYVFGAP
eukprot:GHVN01059459.1.p1 GENE.GHVN01059459.1~~GHVN01059459.1.p1  ORF type:complete len:550 (-),score=57.99 GHVN01059459.1:40-1689(-)